VDLLDLSTQEGLLVFAVLAAYPIMNAVLMVTALPILVRVWKKTKAATMTLLHSNGQTLPRLKIGDYLSGRICARLCAL
jgi:hypothetical protein